MKRYLLTLRTLAISMVLSTVASAQQHHHHHRHGIGGSQSCAARRNSYGAVYGGFASGMPGVSYEESVLRGMAAYTRAVGQANLLNSQAAVQLQQARTQQLANQQLKTETYFKLKEINTASREANRPTRLSQDQYVTLAKRQAPDRLSAFDYDRALGRLNWPAALTSDDFAAERELLDAVFADRTPADTGAGSEFHSTVRQLTGSLQSKLQSELSTMSPMEFIAAKKFLTGLTYESQQPLNISDFVIVRRSPSGNSMNL